MILYILTAHKLFSEHTGGAAYNVGLAGWHGSAAPRQTVTSSRDFLSRSITWHVLCIENYGVLTVNTSNSIAPCEWWLTLSTSDESLKQTKTSGSIRRCSARWPRALEILLKNLSTYFWQVVLMLEKCVWIADMFNSVAKWFESISGKKLAGPKELA